MVSKNTPNYHKVSIPADLGLPKFHLATRVRARTIFPGTKRIQTDDISGLVLAIKRSLSPRIKRTA